MTTSTADQVGARSSRWASSWASSTTAALSRPTGAQEAARVPTTTLPPDRAAAHSSGRRATGTPTDRNRATRCSARLRAAVTTRTPSGPVRWTSSNTTNVLSSAGARRTTDGPSTARAASTRSTDPPPGEAGRPSPGPDGAAGRTRTTRGGDAVPRNDDVGPAQRHAAQSASATTAGGGPIPLQAARSTGWTPGSGTTSASTTQAPTRRPCSGIRTRDPTSTESASAAGTE